jgi:hypothetical protein
MALNVNEKQCKNAYFEKIDCATTAKSYIMCTSIAGWSSLVARRAHNPKVVGSNPAPATRFFKAPFRGFLFSACQNKVN